MPALRSKAANLLRTSFLAPTESHQNDSGLQKQASPSILLNLEPDMSEKALPEEQISNPDRHLSMSSAEKTFDASTDPTVVHDIDGQALVRTIPS